MTSRTRKPIQLCVAVHPQTGEACSSIESDHLTFTGKPSLFGGHRYIAPGTAYCGDCDGVGWVEGGTTIQTTCTRCGGDGWEPIP